MSNLVREYHAAIGSPEPEELIEELGNISPDDKGPYTLLWRSFTGQPQHWVKNLVVYVLSYDADRQTFTLVTNNYVA
jgi:hypothetical protein